VVIYTNTRICGYQTELYVKYVIRMICKSNDLSCSKEQLITEKETGQ